MQARAPLSHLAMLVAGFLARPCCSIPAALALLGMGGSGVAVAIAPYRGWFLLGAGVFFAISFHLNFIRNKSRPGMVVWGLSVVIAAGLLLGPLTAAGPGLDNEQEDTMVERQLEEVTLKVHGMACDACIRRVKETLSNIGGVRDISVDYAPADTVVRYAPDEISAETIAHRIEQAGFKAEPATTENEK